MLFVASQFIKKSKGVIHKHCFSDVVKRPFLRVLNWIRFSTLQLKACQNEHLLSSQSSQVSKSNILFRNGKRKDVSFLFTRLFSEKMNFLAALSPQYFLLAILPETEQVVGFGQLKPLNKHIRELSSLYVFPEYRGRRIGSAIVTALLKREKELSDDAQVEIYLTCPLKTSSFYVRFGFVPLKNNETSTLHILLRIEQQIGNWLVKRAVSNEETIIIMRRTIYSK